MFEEFKEIEVKAAGAKRVLNVRPDTPDIRDRYYEPALIQLAREVDRSGGRVLDQGTEGACTGFGLASVINLLNMKHGQAFEASPRMLYEMARKHDEWPGEDYAGSSCRGAIRGWKNMGVCSSTDWKYVSKKRDEVLTIERAMAARENPLGAYYRLRPNIVDYHAALNEVEAIYVSGRVHSGWNNPKKSGQGLAIVQPNPRPTGGHAFAIVGYNELGFIVQNSWGEKWGSDGFAIWLYSDWQSNVSDGWVFRLGVPTPTIFGLEAKSTAPVEESEFFKKAPKRQEIAGHFAHFDDGEYEARGSYWTTAADIQQTATRIRDNSKWYKHIVVFVHGGLNGPKASANRIAALKDGFTRNGIYPFHIMYDTGLSEELKDIVLRGLTGAEARSEGFFSRLKDAIIERTDKMIEGAVQKPGTAFWDEMKRDAHRPFDVSNKKEIPDGLDAIKILAATLKGTATKLHLAGHSTGGVLIGHLLNALDTLKTNDLIKTCTLFAPACTLDFYKENYAARLKPNHRGTRLPVLDIYNLSAKLELNDNVAKAYRKSLLWLVSNALERERGKPLLGMQLFSKELEGTKRLNLIYSTGKGKITTSKTHGGFDNDTHTMNSLLKRILNTDPKKPFTDVEMEGY